MNLQELKSGARRELDMLDTEANALKDHLKDGFADVKNLAKSGLDQVKEAAAQAGSEAEAIRARANEEIRQARKYVDERFGGSSLGAAQSTEKTK